LGFPVDVFISVVIPVVSAPVSGEGVFIRTRTGRVRVVRGYGASTICAASDVRDGTLVPLVSPGVTEAAEELLVALLSVVTNLVAGLATRPGPLVFRTIGTNMTAVPTHGAEGVHVDGGRGSRTGRGRSGRSGADSGVGVKGGRCHSSSGPCLEVRSSDLRSSPKSFKVTSPSFGTMMSLR
jgi:hypothetical protein